MDFAEASSVKDMELRSLSREVATLRSAAADGGVGAVSGRAAMEAAVAAAAAEVGAAVGDMTPNGAQKGTLHSEEEETAREKEEMKEQERRDMDGYERRAKRYIVISDTDDDDQEEDDEEEDDDEEWLPGALSKFNISYVSPVLVALFTAGIAKLPRTL